MDIEARIIEAYQDAKGTTKRRGAKAWFARLAKVDPSTVSRWCRGEGDENAEGYLHAYWTGRGRPMTSDPEDSPQVQQASGSGVVEDSVIDLMEAVRKAVRG